jgi:hypothetical protein
MWFPLVNVDILTEGYFADSLKALGSKNLRARFYLKKFKERRKILRQSMSTIFMMMAYFSYYDKFSLTEEIEESSLALRYIDHNAKLKRCGFYDM